ncbi:MAG: Methylated-DNA--protein-cysteine methyltransferase [Syntrophus sp. SKADARSKE-3]|nr:Methylated-DNA--protein-cysteine methyltransferase [Syntrophus sp. SKADARSKE-3]
MISADVYYRILQTPLGEIGLVWTETATTFSLCRILLPPPDGTIIDRVTEAFPLAASRKTADTDNLSNSIIQSIKGQPADFNFDILDLNPSTTFQRKVLSRCFLIPKGRVVTYGVLALSAGTPRGARAIGTVMANNPFPIIIPCHRVIRADRSLGGFGGGLAMKKALLIHEEVRFDQDGKVDKECLMEATVQTY